MKTPEEYVDLWKSSVPRLADVFKIAQTEAYNQALDDLMNDVEKSSFTGDMKETIRQMTEILKK